MGNKCVRRTMCVRSLAIALAIIGGASAPPLSAQDPASQPLIQFADLVYVGAFRLPSASANGDNFSLGGKPFAFNPANDTLFVGSKAGRIAEVAIPILSDLPMVKDLSLSLALRSTDSNVSGRDETWKAAVEWSMTDSVRFRGGVQHAVRSPNVNELFAPQLNNFPTFTNQDPCNTTGSIAAQYRNGPNGAQVTALCGQQSPRADDADYNQPSSQANAVRFTCSARR